MSKFEKKSVQTVNGVQSISFWSKYTTPISKRFCITDNENVNCPKHYLTIDSKVNPLADCWWNPVRRNTHVSPHVQSENINYFMNLNRLFLCK